MKKETCGNLLTSIINARLPKELRLYLSRMFENNLWNIDDLLTFLKTDIEDKERLISDSNYNKLFDGNEVNKSKNSNSSDNHNPCDNTKERCPFCNLNNHPPSRCLKVSNSVS